MIKDRRVLIVESNDEVRVQLERLLIDAGILPQNIFVYKQSPLIDLQHRTVTNIDLIFLDLVSPLPNGLAIFQDLMADPALEHIPVIAITDKITKENVESIHETGFKGVIGKPIHEDNFSTTLQHILTGKPVELIK